MKRSRFTEEQIIGILREQEAGVTTAEVCRRHGVSSATFYKWKAMFGGLDVLEARRLKSLEDENARFKRMLADAMLDNVALKGCCQSNGKGAPLRRLQAIGGVGEFMKPLSFKRHRFQLR